MARGEQWAETGVGAVVLAAAGVFLVYALGHAGGVKAGGYELIARFGQAGSLAPGAEVKVAGVKVGTVASIALDPKTFQAETHILVNPSVQLPDDSTAKITSDSLLGGQHIAIEPGGSATNFKPGAQFQNTQGAVDLFGLIGQVIRPQGQGASSPAAGGEPAKPQGADPYPASSSQ
jgi:phospholipid/cholesterol/gamma-HCH transport system substrate-binding protein